MIFSPKSITLIGQTQIYMNCVNSILLIKTVFQVYNIFLLDCCPLYLYLSLLFIRPTNCDLLAHCALKTASDLMSLVVT